MVVQDITFGIGILIIFTYAVIYRKNKMIGNIMFIAEGIMLSLATTTYMEGVALLFTAGAIGNFLLCAFNDYKESKQGSASESTW